MASFEITPRRPTAPAERPITIAITAIGGQGGGVLADWVVSLAEAGGYLAQYTSVAGVAQRTGATIYYLELFPAAAAQAEGREPVLALMPVSGDVDVVLAAELMEAGRALGRGLITGRTTLVASSHRIYGIAEKTAMGDGLAKADPMIELIQRRAKRVVMFDMADLAERNGSVISAVLFGALAGSGVLPFLPSAYEAAIEAGGIGVKSSLAAFRAGLEQARSSGPVTGVDDGQGGQPSANLQPTTPAGRALLERIGQRFPVQARPVLGEGAKRIADYQDSRYAQDYLDRLDPILAVDQSSGGATQGFRLTDETARALALWMSYEDVIRVADIKTRPSRFARVREEVKAADRDLVYMSEFMHPRLEELCDTLPAGLGAWLEGADWAKGLLKPLFSNGRRVSTGKLGGFVLLYLVAGLRPTRRASLRYRRETVAMTAWLSRIQATAPSDYNLAVEIALCQALVKGYGDTHARGMGSFNAIMAEIDAGRAGAVRVRALRAAALADEAGQTLQTQLAATSA
jgi:indolepyruvate ferredoxin oxidoreductase beta subunit